MKYLQTAECVASGHPDKICDQISDAIVDAALTQDPTSRIAVETLVTAGVCAVAGEVSTNHPLPYEAIARTVISDLGYTHPEFGFDATCTFHSWIHEQSSDIARGVDTGGAGDQGSMVGYATDETEEFLPLPYAIARKLVQTMDILRQTKTLAYLRPDGKAQCTLSTYSGKTAVVSLICAVPHDPRVDANTVKNDLIKHAIQPVLEHYSTTVPQEDRIIVNGTGIWTIGGLASDTGVTGRKLVADTYGPTIPHGGGAFSGKDPTKVDRSGAYACRYAAKNVVASGRAKQCQVRVSYCIGQKKPQELSVDCFGTEHTTMTDIYRYVNSLLSFEPSDIIHTLGLVKPIYRQTATYGHFGKKGLPWEQIRGV